MLLRLTALTLALCGGAVAQDAAVPDCADLPGNEAGMTTCALISDPLVLAFVYGPVAEGAVLQITQSTAEGGDRRDSAPIIVKGVEEAPQLYDMDGDGEAEVFVPLSVSDLGTTYALWRRADDGFFAPVDTVTTTAPQRFIPEGDLIRHTGLPDGPDGDVTIESAYLLDNGGLSLVYAVQMDAASGACTMMTGRSVWNEAIILADCEARLNRTDLEEESQ